MMQHRSSCFTIYMSARSIYRQHTPRQIMHMQLTASLPALQADCDLSCALDACPYAATGTFAA